jgi:GT2 family glycosyltransferase
MPTVSVITPAFNAAGFLSTAVASVLAQTFADLELLIVDDGSTDDTLAVSRRLAAGDARVRVLHQPNAGPGPARNTAFREARGRYFAFLDSDDEWHPEFLASHVAVLERRPDIDVLIGNAWLRGGSRDGRPARPVRGGGRVMSLAEILADEDALFIMAVFRREVVEAIGGFDPALLTNEEAEMWWRAAIAGFAFARNPAPLGWYQCRPGSLSSSETRMLGGVLKICAKTRLALPAGSPERAVLDRQMARFEVEFAAAQVRESVAGRDLPAAARHLSTLYAVRGGWLLGLAARVPRAALAVYQLRRQLKDARQLWPGSVA